jgi:hypothetical protein
VSEHNLEITSAPSRYNIRHRRNKAVSAPRKRFHISRRFGSVVQNLPNPGDGIIQTVVEIDERVSRPEQRLQFSTGNHFAGPLDKDGQDLKGLSREPKPQATFAQLS